MFMSCHALERRERKNKSREYHDSLVEKHSIERKKKTERERWRDGEGER